MGGGELILGCVPEQGIEQKKPTVATETEIVYQGVVCFWGRPEQTRVGKMVQVQKIGTFVLHSRGFGAHSQYMFEF